MTESLKQALAELYYSEACYQKGWAFVPVSDIRMQESIIEFRKGQLRIKIKVPTQLIQEITTNTVFDYLVCQLGHKENYDNPTVANPLALCWVKAGKSFSQAQVDALEKTRIPLALFAVRNLLDPPDKVEVMWDIRPAKKWLDDLDDKRDEAESDDDYL